MVPISLLSNIEVLLYERAAFSTKEYDPLILRFQGIFAKSRMKMQQILEIGWQILL